MRILQINQCHYKRGGADVVYLNTIDLLQSNGHEVACISTQNPLNEHSAFNNYFVSYSDARKQSFVNKLLKIQPYLYNYEAYNQTERLIKDFKPDIAHVHLFNAFLSVSILDVLHKHKIPVVHTVHDYKLLCPSNGLLDAAGEICEACVNGSILNCIKKRCSESKFTQSAMITLEAFHWKYLNHPLDYIDAFHFVSNFSKKKHLEYLPNIENKATVFYNFTSVHPKKSSEVIEKYYLYFGRLSPEKGITTLIDTWKRLPNHMKLKIVGGGHLFNKLYKEIEFHESKNIELLGYKSGIELESIIQNAYFVIVPSESYENNPMTIIESYSLGIPVIGSNIGGIPEIINNNQTGYLFEPRNTVQLQTKIQLANNLNADDYINFSKNALEFADSNFAKDIFYDHLMELYNKTITGSKLHPSN
ncbi:MAG TPA: glycosyltransferase [Prolixibacteraceae bacterium]|jgi:glycosyltransferase involved in cell wall biosynthesis